MMQAWKYSLPAFLVPFFLSTTQIGYSLLIVGGNWPDFLLATATSVCSLFFVSLGIIGYMRRKFPMVERVLLIGPMFVVLIVELLNSAIEATVDRIGLERHALSGLAKDLGSAAVLLSLGLLVVTWILVLGTP